ncbi:MAG: hypothetical protein GXO26_04750, partial [Crenarchaeota archaeon]|nr:hypothetical protein [Thermoproteota archaeon]
MGFATVRVRDVVKDRIRLFAARLGMSEADVVELAIYLMELVRTVPAEQLKIYVEPRLIEWLYNRSTEFRT